MNPFVNLTDDIFMLYAVKAYDNPNCKNSQEFYDDLATIKYIKRLLRRYKIKGAVMERLLLNHIIIFYNIFGVEAASRILFLKLEKDLWPSLKTFLVYLRFMPEVVKGINGVDIISSDIPIDMKLANILRGI
jgi:hypothetical protein